MEHELEAVAQCFHIWILVFLHFVALGNDAHHPVGCLCVFGCLEEEEEVTRVLGVDAEAVVRSVRVGCAVRVEPIL